ncbi:phosphodiester glycosidase family protein [Candidatus Beckwithbacteria bacterium]|nr:phosphodiester glycosidase family protein [Candidatus Beckwithbacteria bacterium]
MKKIFTLIFFLALILAFFYLQKNSQIEEAILPTSTPQAFILPQASFEKTLAKMQAVDFLGKNYKYQLYQIENPKKLSLYPNFTDQEKTSILFQKNACQFLTNASFYTTEDLPLGAFTTNFEEIKKPIKSLLLDGFICSKENQVDIALTCSLDNPRWLLQAGPLLILNNKELKLTIQNDEARRRVLAFQDNKKDFYFLVLTQDKSLNLGPLLADLPAILITIGLQEKIEIQNAINLDGGSASAFITSDLEIEETNYIGGYFCEK